MSPTARSAHLALLSFKWLLLVALLAACGVEPIEPAPSLRDGGDASGPSRDGGADTRPPPPDATPDGDSAMDAADGGVGDGAAACGASAPVSCGGRMCVAGERCNAWTRRCQSCDEPYPPPGQDNGGQCTVDADCRSAGGSAEGFDPLCITTNGADYCTSECALPADFGVPDTFVQSDCPAGSVCLLRSQVIPDPGDLGRCVRECRVDSDCRTEDGYFCRRQFGERTYTNGYCAPSHCTSRGCIGYQCFC